MSALIQPLRRRVALLLALALLALAAAKPAAADGGRSVAALVSAAVNRSGIACDARPQPVIRRHTVRPGTPEKPVPTPVVASGTEPLARHGDIPALNGRELYLSNCRLLR